MIPRHCAICESSVEPTRHYCRNCRDRLVTGRELLDESHLRRIAGQKTVMEDPEHIALWAEINEWTGKHGLNRPRTYKIRLLRFLLGRDHAEMDRRWDDWEIRQKWIFQRMEEISSQYETESVNRARMLLDDNIPLAQRRYRAKQQRRQASRLNEREKRELVRLQDDALIEAIFAKQLFHSSEYTIEGRDFARRNEVESLFTRRWKARAIQLYGGRCANCLQRHQLQVDHVWLTKLMGGNYIMAHSQSGVVVANVCPLCASCNSAKGQDPLDVFFAPERARGVCAILISLSSEMNRDLETKRLLTSLRYSASMRRLGGSS